MKTSHATIAPPPRFQPPPDPGWIELATETSFRPLTYYVRVRESASGTRSEKARLVLRTFVGLILTQLLYVLLAVIIYALIARVFVLRHVIAGGAMFLFTLVAVLTFSFAWHAFNNLEEVKRRPRSELYVALDLALIRSAVMATSGFFLGFGSSLLLGSSTGEPHFFQPALLAVVFFGLALGSQLRLTIGLNTFVSYFGTDRRPRFYLESWKSRRESARGLMAVGWMLLATAGAIQVSGYGHDFVDRLFTPKVGTLGPAYLGVAALVTGLITTWGFQFFISWLRHTVLVLKWRKGTISAAEALLKGPLVFDELFLVPIPAIKELLVAVGEPAAGPGREDERLEWLFFVMTQTYQSRRAAQVCAQLLARGEVGVEELLSHLRDRPQVIDVLQAVADFLPPSLDRMMLRSLSSPLDEDRILAIVEETGIDGTEPDPSREWRGTINCLSDFASITRTTTIEEWRLRTDRAQCGDPLCLAAIVEDLEQSRRMIIDYPRSAPYRERAQRMHEATLLLRAARNTIARNPWISTLLSSALEQWDADLQHRVRQTLGSADIELRVPPVTLLADTEQQLSAVLVNHGPGSAHAIDANLIHGARLVAADQPSCLLGPRDRQLLSFTVTLGSPGSFRAEIELRFTDDLGEKHLLVEPVELAIRQGRRSHQTFPNPFTPGRAVTSESGFQGRSDLLERLTARPFPSVYVHGARRIGKTSLLYRLEKTSATRPCRLLDLQALHGYEDRSALESRLERALTGPAGGADYREALRSHLNQPGRPVLLIDEADYFERIDAVLRGGLAAELRGCLNRPTPGQIVLAGHGELGGLEDKGPLFDLGIMLQDEQLGLLEAEETEALLTEPLRDHMDIQPAALLEFVRLTGGHPHVAQVLASATVAAAHSTQQHVLSSELLEEACGRALGDLEVLFRSYLWGSLTPSQQGCLASVASGNPVGATATCILARLSYLGIISKSTNRVAIGLFERWLREGPLRETVDMGGANE